MKITWIVPGFQSHEKDRCIPALTDLAHAIAAEHDLTVYALQYPGREDKYRVGKVQIHSFKAGPPAKIPQLRRFAPLYRAIRAIQKQNFEVLHAFWAAEPALAGVIAKKLTKKPLIVSCMGGEPARLPEIGYGAGLHRLDRLYLKLAVKGATILTCGSQTQANLVKAQFPKQIQPIVQPLGIDLSRFSVGKAFTTEDTGESYLIPEQIKRDFRPSPQPSPQKGEGANNIPLFTNYSVLSPQHSALNLLAVGSLLPVKGHANLIRAMAIVRQTQPQVRLKIVGEGQERLKLENLIAELDLTEVVCLAGAIPAENMPNEYTEADIFVLSSYYESQCVALGEALACGLPAIAPPVGYAPELLGDGQAGELANNNTPQALAEAILKILVKKEKWSEMRQAARQKAEAVSLENSTKGFMTLYENFKTQMNTDRHR